MMPAGRAGSSMRSVMAEPVSAARLPPVPASATGAAAPPLSRRRSIAVWALIVVASVISLISILTIWVDRQMLDNNSWRRATEQVVNDPEVRHALATRLVNTVYANTDVAGSLEQRLPENLTGLAVPLADGLHGPAISGAEELLSRPRFRQLVINASVAAHDKLVNVLENTTGHGISTGNGVVTLDVKELLRQIAHDLGLPGKAVEKLPDDAGVITLMRSDQLTAAQNGVRLVNALSAWLLVAVLVLYGLAIYLAHGARRRTLARVAWGVITVGLLVLLVRRALGNYIVDALASGADRSPLRADRGARRDARRRIVRRSATTAAHRSRRRCAADHHVGKRGIHLLAPRAVGWHARPAHVVGNPAPRRPPRPRHRRTRASVRSRGRRGAGKRFRREWQLAA
jgi:hypothetical protein